MIPRKHSGGCRAAKAAAPVDQAVCEHLEEVVVRGLLQADNQALMVSNLRQQVAPLLDQCTRPAQQNQSSCCLLPLAPVFCLRTHLPISYLLAPVTGVYVMRANFRSRPQTCSSWRALRNTASPAACIDRQAATAWAAYAVAAHRGETWLLPVTGFSAACAITVVHKEACTSSLSGCRSLAWQLSRWQHASVSVLQRGKCSNAD